MIFIYLPKADQKLQGLDALRMYSAESFKLDAA